jgi:hypothetical protein
MPKGSRTRTSDLGEVVPHGEGEHAAEASAARFTPVQEGREHDLRIALGPEGPSMGLKFGAQFAEIEQSSIEHQGVASIVALPRLMSLPGDQ